MAFNSRYLRLQVYAPASGRFGDVIVEVVAIEKMIKCIPVEVVALDIVTYQCTCHVFAPKFEQGCLTTLPSILTMVCQARHQCLPLLPGNLYVRLEVIERGHANHCQLYKCRHSRDGLSFSIDALKRYPLEGLGQYVV